MLSVAAEQALAARNCIVDAWIEDVLAAHKAPASQCSQNQRTQLPKFYPSPVNSSGETPSFLSYALRPTNRRGKRKRGLHPLQDAGPNMNPTPSQPPPPFTPERGAAQKSTGTRPRKGKSDKTEAQGEETPRPKRFTRSSSALAQATASPATQRHGLGSSPLAYASAMVAYAKAALTEENVEDQTPRSRRARVTQSVSSPLAQAGTSQQRPGSRATQRLQLGSLLDDQVRLPPPLNLANTSQQRRATQQHESGSPLNDQVRLSPSLSSAYTSAISDNTTLTSRTKSQPKSTGGASARSRIPITSITDLAFAEKPIRMSNFPKTTQLPLDVREMYGKLRALSNGKEILPAVIKDELAEIAEYLEPYMFDKGTAGDSDMKTQLLDELKDLDKIQTASGECWLGQHSEAGWNCEVHSPVLRLAVESFVDVKQYNVTTACVVPDLVPRHVSGDTFKSKAVDFTVNLVPDDKMYEKILLMIQDLPYSLRTINQTSYDPVRFQPIAISIETKTPNTSEADAMIQLGMWVAAHFKRIRMFSHGKLVTPTLPLLYVSGAQWSLLFAIDRGKHVELLGKLNIGDTDTVVGCYKLLASLRCLCEWVTTIFKDWLELSVIRSNQG